MQLGNVKVVKQYTEKRDGIFVINFTMSADRNYGDLAMEFYDANGEEDYLYWEWNKSKKRYECESYEIPKGKCTVFLIENEKDDIYYVSKERLKSDKYASIYTFVSDDYSKYDFTIAKQGIIMTPEEKTSCKGETVTIKVSGAKSKVKFTTSNKKIGKITSKTSKTCNVKLLKAGTVKITAKIGKYNRTCKIKVNKYDDLIMKLLPESYNMLRYQLKFPSTLKIEDTYYGKFANPFYRYIPYGSKVIMFHYSAMNSYEMRVHGFFFGWYMDNDMFGYKKGDFAFQTTDDYNESSLKDRQKINYKDVIK